MVNIMRGLTILVYAIVILFYIKFFSDLSLTGSRDKLGDFFNCLLTTITGVIFTLSVFVKPANYFRRRLLKWSVVLIMAANFIYGSMYVSDHISSSNGMIIFSVCMQVALTGLALVCHQWELELLQIQMLEAKLSSR